jgi:hypothetical protein
VPAETGRRYIVDVASVTLKKPAFIGVFGNRLKESHSLRQFEIDDFLSVSAGTDRSTILSAFATPWSGFPSVSGHSIA